jgi:hypothetical protein
MTRKSFFPRKYLSLGGGGGVLLGLLLPRGFGCSFFFLMAPSLHPPLVQNISCPHCFSLYILGGLSRHVKSVHPPTSLIS